MKLGLILLLLIFSVILKIFFSIKTEVFMINNEKWNFVCGQASYIPREKGMGNLA